MGTKDTILEAIEKEVLPIPGESGFPDLKPHLNVPTSSSNEEMKKNGAPFHSQDPKAKKAVPKDKETNKKFITLRSEQKKEVQRIIGLNPEATYLDVLQISPDDDWRVFRGQYLKKCRLVLSDHCKHGPDHCKNDHKKNDEAFNSE